MKTIAIIVAAGLSLRFQSQIPKQYSLIDGTEVLKMVVEKFKSHPLIDEVVVVINEMHLKFFKALKMKNINYCFGGSTRNQSVHNGIKMAIELYSPDNILIHDGVRPFVDDHIISNVVKSLDEFDAVDVGITVRDTLKSKNPLKTYNRDNFYLTHTPQGFKTELLTRLYSDNTYEGFTDEISMAIEANVKVGFVESNIRNLKITYKEDLL